MRVKYRVMGKSQICSASYKTSRCISVCMQKIKIKRICIVKFIQYNKAGGDEALKQKL